MCEPLSVRLANATSCDAVRSSNKQDLIKIIVPTPYASNKFSYHEKTNFKRITRVKLNIANLCNALCRTTFCT